LLVSAVEALPCRLPKQRVAQFSYRFAIDWLPMILIAIVFGGGARRPFACWSALGRSGAVRRVAVRRRPGQLFVTELLAGFEIEIE
jgi:hypothetical protein